MRLPDGSKLDYHHEKGGALSAIDLNGARLTTHQFVCGREQQRQQGQLTSHYHYDDQGRLQAHAINQQTRALYLRHYGYAVNGNLATLADSRHGQRSYYYDPLNRLIRVRHTRDDRPETFAHDPAGNLLMQDRPGLATVKGNRLLMQGDRHYDYDAFGNLIRERRGTAQKIVTEYAYDCQHRMVGVTTPDGRRTRYSYDAFGRRISKTVDGQTTEFFWQGDHLVAENSREHYRSYVYEPGSSRPLAMLDGKGPKKACPFYYQLDHLGTPLELTDYGGEIVWSAKYNAHGKVTQLTHGGGEQLEQPLRFQGQYFDPESGLHYNRHRYYDPDVGRYLTPDPVKLAGGLNQYRYALNPTGWVDPLGLSGNCPGKGECNNPTLGNTDSLGKVSAVAAEPQVPATERATPKSGYHKETYANNPVKPEHATLEREKFLGEGPYTNTHPRTKSPDPDRLVSADGKRSIRYGAHEMGNSPSKHHYHEEKWILELKGNVMNVENTVVRVPLPKKQK